MAPEPGSSICVALWVGNSFSQVRPGGRLPSCALAAAIKLSLRLLLESVLPRLCLPFDLRTTPFVFDLLAAPFASLVATGKSCFCGVACQAHEVAQRLASTP